MRLRLRIKVHESVQQLEADNAQVRSGKFLIGIDTTSVAYVADLQHILLRSLTIKNAKSGMHFKLGIDGYMLLPNQDIGIFNQNEELTLYATPMKLSSHSRESVQQLLVSNAAARKSEDQHIGKKRKYKQILSAEKVLGDDNQVASRKKNHISSRYDGDSSLPPESFPGETKSHIRRSEQQNRTETDSNNSLNKLPYQKVGFLPSPSTSLDVYSHWKELQRGALGARVESIASAVVVPPSSKCGRRKRGGRRNRRSTSCTDIRVISNAAVDDCRNTTELASELAFGGTCVEQITEFAQLEIGDVISFKVVMLCEKTRSPIVNESIVEGTIVSLGASAMNKRVGVCCQQSTPLAVATSYSSSLPHNNISENSHGSDNKLHLFWSWEELASVQRIKSGVVETEKCGEPIVCLEPASPKKILSVAQSSTKSISTTSSSETIDSTPENERASCETIVNDDFGFMDAILQKRLELASKRMEALS